MPPKKVIMAGGGTGGHIYPALAIASGLKQKFPQTEILFVGTDYGLEKELVPRAGFPLKKIRVKGFRRKLSFDTLVSLKELVFGVMDSIKIISKEKPDLVIGTGGYVAGPIVFLASIMGIPTLIHEQNASPGITNRILSHFVDKVAISFPDSVKFFSHEKTVLTGNPVRKEITCGDRAKALKKYGLSSDLPVVLCFGGSQGAARLNNAILHMADVINATNKFQLIHITGKKHYEHIKSLMENKGIDLAESGQIIVKPYIYEMQDAYAAADLVISRAGALSIAEITVCGKPSILIPLPTAANHHQDYNAEFLENNGACVIFFEEDLSGERLLNTVEDIIFDEQRLQEMSKASKNLGSPDALEKILNEVLNLVK